MKAHYIYQLKQIYIKFYDNNIIEKNNNFANYMIKLSKIALLQNIPIIITNQLLQNNEKNYQRMNTHLENYIHQKIKLEKIKKNFKGRISSPFINNIEFSYYMNFSHRY